jgi:broad specificity phosphatase PhoE
MLAEPLERPPISAPELVEVDVGRWLGMSWVEIQERDADRFAAFHADFGQVPYPGGESLLDVARRAVPAVAAIAEAHPGGRIAVVAHHIVNRSILGHLLGLTPSQARPLRQANGCINVLEFGEGAPVVATINACLHLEGLEPSGTGAPPAPPGPRR